MWSLLKIGEITMLDFVPPLKFQCDFWAYTQMASFTFVRPSPFDQSERQNALENEGDCFIQSVAVERMFVHEECLKEGGGR